MRYKASYDITVKLLTNAGILLALGLLGWQTYTRWAYTGGWIAIVIFLLSITVSWSLHPQYYDVSDQSIIIRRPFGQLRIALDTVIHIRPITREELGFNLRRLGAGGMFGYLGYYRSSRMGPYQMWASHRDRLVVIETAKGKYVISPDQPVHFTNDVNSRRYRH